MGNDEDPKVGVFVCHCGKNIAGVIDVEKLAEYAKSIPNVVFTKDFKFMCSNSGQELIAEALRDKKIDRVVVAACSPLMHEPTFRRVLDQNNVNQFFFEQANIREHISWVSMAQPDRALLLAKDHVKMAVSKVSNNKPLEIQKFSVAQEVLVVGAGISGMFAALDLTKKYKVHLVERSPTIGGHMSQLDKTFPTMDCSACITTPKMVEVGRDPNINLMTCSEVIDVEPNVGNYIVKIKKKAKKIDHEICTSCGVCAEVCPITAPNEFDMGLGHRTAAYIPFPQAVPSQYTINDDDCIRCGICVTNCEVGAIDLEQQDEIIEITVGSVIICTGNDIFDPSGISRYGYNKYKNVVTGIEMERLLSSYGPTLGKLKRPSDHETPQKIAFLQCVGSRDFQDGAHSYCSRVCCMYAIKQARIFKEKHPESEVYIFYMDIRAFGKGYEEFYEISAREYGINFIRGRIGEVYEEPDGGLLIIGTDTLLGERLELKVDMLVLSSGLESRKDAKEVARLFAIQCTEDGMFMERHPKLFPVDSLTDGVFIAGTCVSPRDIPDSIAQAKAAASSADNFMVLGEVAIDPYYAYVLPEKCSGCKSCISMCPYEAIFFDDLDKVSVINTLKCKGCGACMVTCPSEAIVQNHFTKKQILGELESILSLTIQKAVN